MAERSYEEGARGCELRQCLSLANVALAKIRVDEEVPTSLRLEVEELDFLLDPGEYVFSGWGIVSREDMLEDAPLDYIAVASGTNGGFMVGKFGRPGFEHWAVGWLFSETVPGATLEDDPVTVDYVLHTGARHSTVLIDAIESAFPEDLAFPDTVHQVLSRKSDELAELLRHETFFDLDCDEQKYFIDSSLEAANDACAELRSPLQGKRFAAMSERAYVLRTVGRASTYVEVDTSDICLKGTCEELAVLGRRQLAFGQAITEIEQLVDAQSGMCLVVRIDAETAAELDLPEKQEVFLPISGQNLEVTFDEMTIQQL